MLGLYIHVPFCSAICNYCNFNRGLFDAGLKGRYVEALLLEIERGRLRPCELEAGEGRERASAKTRAGGGAPAQLKKSWQRVAADTIYFGGGTPSLLEPHDI